MKVPWNHLSWDFLISISVRWSQRAAEEPYEKKTLTRILSGVCLTRCQINQLVEISQKTSAPKTAGWQNFLGFFCTSEAGKILWKGSKNNPEIFSEIWNFGILQKTKAKCTLEEAWTTVDFLHKNTKILKTIIIPIHLLDHSRLHHIHVPWSDDKKLEHDFCFNQIKFGVLLTLPLMVVYNEFMFFLFLNP